MRHTPGPWIVQETNDGMTVRTNRRRLEIVAPLRGGGDMVVVGTHTGLDCLEDANARLIAAAPRMLEMLEELVTMHLVGPECAVIRNEARALLREIEGEEAAP